MTDPLEHIDVSYWKTKDKQWMAERQEKWPEIEFMLSSYKNRRGLNIIKAFYLRGKMPNWDALKDWGEYLRHLDLFVFLWLHPSWEAAVLKELRDLYISSELIVKDDLERGFGEFLGSQITIAAMPAASMDEISFPYIEGHGELLFSVMLGDPIQTEYKLKALSLLGKTQVYSLGPLNLAEINVMSAWLCLKKLLPIHKDFLYQYRQPLEWWYESSKEINFFDLDRENRKQIPRFQKDLYRIHHFDVNKEGDTCRSRFVMHIRKILDERPFFSEFEEMWRQVKSGEIHIENAFER